VTEPHRIRLRGHWQVTPLDDDRNRHMRRFGRPRTLDVNEHLWVVCAGLPADAVVTVNGVLVGSGNCSVDITEILDLRNEVTIEVPALSTIDEVLLEVRTM